MELMDIVDRLKSILQKTGRPRIPRLMGLDDMKAMMAQMGYQTYPAEIHAIINPQCPPNTHFEDWELLKRKELTLHYSTRTKTLEPHPDCASHTQLDIVYLSYCVDIRIEEIAEDDLDWDNAYESCTCKGYRDDITAFDRELDDHIREAHHDQLFPDGAHHVYNYRIFYSSIEKVYTQYRERAQLRILGELQRLDRSNSCIAHMARSPLFDPNVLRLLFRTVYIMG